MSDDVDLKNGRRENEVLGFKVKNRDDFFSSKPVRRSTDPAVEGRVAEDELEDKSCLCASSD